MADHIVLDPSAAIPVIRTPEQTYILNAETDQSIRTIHDEAKAAIEYWYAQKNPAQAMEEIKNKDALLKAHREEAYQSVSLDNKTDDNVIDVLKHRDEVMRKKAISILEDRLRSPDSEASRVADLTDKLREVPRLLLGMLNTEDKEALTKALTIICTVLNEKLSEKLRQIGGIGTIGKLAALKWGEAEEEFSQFLIFAVLFLSRNEENREVFRSTGALLDLVHYLESPFEKVKAMATQALLNLSLPEKNQPVITRGGALNILFQTVKTTTDEQLKLETLYVLRNLAYCEEARAAIQQGDLQHLVEQLSPTDAYATEESEGTAEYRQGLSLQKVLLHAILEFANSDRNRYLLSQFGIIKKMLQFFAPLSEKNGLIWNYDILERVLAILDRVIVLEEVRNEFLDSKGLAIVSHVLKDSTKYPEEVILNAAQIITTLATHATMTQQKHAEQGVATLLGLLSQYPDREVIQNFVAKLLKSVAENGLNKNMILARGGSEILIRLVKESRVKPILINAAAGLAALAEDESVVQEIVSADVVGEFVGLLQLNVPELQASLANVLTHVAANDDGADMIIKGGGVMPLITLLHSKEPTVQEAGLLTLAKILFAKDMAEAVQKFFFNAEGHKQLLKLMDSPAEKVRTPSVQIVHALSQLRNGRQAIREAGVQTKLEEYERQGKLDGDDQLANIFRMIKLNLKKEAAENQQRIQEEADRQKREQQEEEYERRKIEESMALIRAVKEEEERKKNQKFWLKVECEGACKVFAVNAQLTYDEFVGVVADHFGLNSWRAMSWRDGPDDITLEDQGDLDHVLDRIQQAKPIVITIHVEKPVLKADAKAAQVEALLMELTPRQLRELVKFAMNQGVNVVPPIKEYINLNRGIRKNMTEEKITNLVAKHRASGPSTSSSGNSSITSAVVVGSTGAPPPPPPPALSEPSKDLDRRKIQEKPAKMEFEASGRSEIGSSLFQELQQGRDALKKATPPPPSSSSSSSSSAFLDDIKKGVKLNNVNIDDHMKKREEERKKESREGLMEEIRKQGGDVHFKLLNQGITYGRKYWINQPERYIEELQKSFLLDYNMITIIFGLVENDETVLFKDVHVKLRDNDKISQGDLANSLCGIGFSVKSQRFVIEGKENEEPLTEYTQIYQPDDIPMPIILKTILATVKGLPADYTYEVVEEDLPLINLPLMSPQPRRNFSGNTVEEIVQEISLTLPPSRSRSNSRNYNNSSNSSNSSKVQEDEVQEMTLSLPVPKKKQ